MTEQAEKTAQPEKVERKVEDTQRRSLRTTNERPHGRRLLTPHKAPAGALHHAVVEASNKSVVILTGAHSKTVAKALKKKYRRMALFPFPAE